MIVNLANKSLIPNCSNVTSEGNNGTRLTSNEDGSLTIKGSMEFGNGKGAARRWDFQYFNFRNSIQKTLNKTDQQK